MAIVNWRCPDDWKQWSEWLAAPLHARNRWRLPVLLLGILFARGRRTVTTWLRAVGIRHDFADYYYFLAPLGRKTESVATQLFSLLLETLPLGERVLAVIDDSPTKRYGPKVEGADIHHNPTPGPADQKYLYGHIWVTISLALRHPLWGALALPLRAMLYVRQKTLPTIPKKRGWQFRTKLELAAQLVEWLAKLVKMAGKTLWVVVDGGYTKLPFLKPAMAAGAVIVGRLRKDAALRDLPPVLRPGQRRGRGRPRKYGANSISLAKRAGQKRGWQAVTCTLYNETVTKFCKTFLATYRPAGGVIRVVLVKEDHGWFALFCTDPHGHRGGDSRSLCRPGNHRAGLPRHQGSLGHWPAAGSQHLDQRGRVSFELVDAYAGGTVGMGPQARCAGRSPRLALGRSRPSPFARGSSQSLAPLNLAKRIIGDHRRWSLPRKITLLARRLLALAL